MLSDSISECFPGLKLPYLEMHSDSVSDVLIIKISYRVHIQLTKIPTDIIIIMMAIQYQFHTVAYFS